MKLVEETIASGAAVTGKADYAPNSLVAVVLPDATYTNSSFTLQKSVGGAWLDVYDNFGSVVSITGSQGIHNIAADLSKDTFAYRLEGSGNEGAERNVTFVFARV